MGAAWDSVRSKAPVAQFAVAATGTLVYAPAADSVPPTKLVWVDREGREQPVIALQAFEPTVALSPDGRHVALAYARGAVARYDVLDLERLTFSTFLESRDNELTSATWSPDGRSLIYPETQVERTHWVRRSVAGNTPAAPFGTMRGSYGAVHGISGDGRYVVGNIVQRETGTDVVIVPTDPEAGGPVAFAATPGEEFSPAISPDGRWIAYVGGEGGGEEVYVAPRSGDGARLTVSSGGGRGPAWSADGRELFFQRGADGGARDAASDLMAVAFDAARPALGVPRKLFSGPYAVGYDMGRTYAVAPDGQRFLMMKANSAQRLSSVNHLVVVQNWFLELNRLR